MVGFEAEIHKAKSHDLLTAENMTILLKVPNTDCLNKVGVGSTTFWFSFQFETLSSGVMVSCHADNHWHFLQHFNILIQQRILFQTNKWWWLNCELEKCILTIIGWLHLYMRFYFSCEIPINSWFHLNLLALSGNENWCEKLDFYEGQARFSRLR